MTTASPPSPQAAALHYPFGESMPEKGTIQSVAPGIYWVRMALPFALDHINLWLLRDELDGRPGWTIVDCGIANADTQAAWEHIFATALDGLPVLRVVVTHMHPDHVGNAEWLTRLWSTPEDECRLWMSATDFNSAHIASQRTLGFGGERAASFFASHGLNDPESIEKIRQRANHFSSMVPAVPHSFRRMMDGQHIAMGGHAWTALAGHGHSPEHISLYCSDLGVMISGDMVLPRISTNVSVIDIEPEADSLTLYLNSLDRLRPLPADTLILPSHGRPFTGLQARIDQLHAHHRDRLAEVMAACSERPTTAAELLPILFRRPLDLHQTTFAMGESVAHLNALWQRGQLTRRRGDDGVLRFRAGDQGQGSAA